VRFVFTEMLQRPDLEHDLAQMNSNPMALQIPALCARSLNFFKEMQREEIGFLKSSSLFYPR
jgi:hypothetical protein